MKYPPEVIKALGDWFAQSESAKDLLLQKNLKELVILPYYIIDGKDEVFDMLMQTRHHILAAFVKAVDKEKKSIKFLLDHKAAHWAAVASFVNGDEKAREWLLRNGYAEYADLADKILERIKKENEDSDFKAIINPL